MSTLTSPGLSNVQLIAQILALGIVRWHRRQSQKASNLPHHLLKCGPEFETCELSLTGIHEGDRRHTS